MAVIAVACDAKQLGDDAATVRRVAHDRVLAATPPATTASPPDPTARPAPTPVDGEAVPIGGTVTAAPSTPVDSLLVMFRDEIEAWRPDVATWFRSVDVGRVLHIIDCESDGLWDAENPNRAANGMYAKGLMQHLDGYWPSRAAKANAAGYRNGGDIWNPIDQLAVSAWLAYNTPQGFDHWSCNP